VINDWRSSIDLEPIPVTEGPCLADVLKVPFTYCWSPALVPKPLDWPTHIDVCGFFFRSPPDYTPPLDLDQFLRSGPPPVYIGFGSIVIEDPAAMTATLLSAVEALGVRAIISRGWSNLGTEKHSDNVFFLGDCPHEWLFRHVSAVVHHGGAGTTACGLLNGRPTVIVPFFGEYVCSPSLARRPIPSQLLNADEAIANYSGETWSHPAG
jgi:UDP:flavonoid glycosyltransferase YjiC (YdhE family)